MENENKDIVIEREYISGNYKRIIGYYAHSHEPFDMIIKIYNSQSSIEQSSNYNINRWVEQFDKYSNKGDLDEDS